MAVRNEKNKKKWTKDGRHWYFICYYKDIYGNRKQYVSKMFKNKEIADKKQALFLLQRDHPDFTEFSVVAEAYFDYISKTKKDSTVYSYKKDYNNHIEPYFNQYYINDININVIRLWASEIDKKPIKTDYKNKIYVILCNIFDFAIKNYGLKENPAKTFGRFQEKNDKIISNKEKIRYITHEEFKEYISYVNDLLYRMFFIFAYYTGCRRGEIQALTWKEIDFENDEIEINKTLYEEVKGKVCITSTKNNQNRIIKMSKYLHDELKAYKKEVMKYSDFSEDWFIFGNTRFLPKTTIDRNKDKYFKISGVKRITMHEFRHSHVSLLINEYVRISKEKNMKVDTAKFFLMLSERMGHTIQVMMDTYMHLFPTVQDEIVDILDSLSI